MYKVKINNIMKINLKINNDAENSTNIRLQQAFLWNQALSTLASSLFGLCQGLTFGITSVMLPQLREDKTIQYDPSHESWIASIVALSVVFSSLICGTITDVRGRKTAHIIFGIPNVVGWIVIACANSTSIILVGRFITGLSTSATRIITMAYIGEIADPKFRTVALFIPTLMLYVGVMLCHVFGYYLHWKISCLICLAPSVICLVTFLFLKESPLWLIAKGKTDEGIKTFRWFRGTDDAAETELKALLEKQSKKPKISVKETLNAVCSEAFIIPMLVLMVVMINVQFSGVNVINFYVLDIFQQVFNGNVDSFTMMIIMDCIRIVTTLSICLFGRFIPKKIAFLTSTFGASLFAFGLVTCLMINGNIFKWLSVSCLIFFICFSSIIATIGWSFVPELLPNSARAFGSGFNSVFTFLLLFIAAKVTPDFMSSYGTTALFAFFGISALVCGVILSFVLPETNGMTLQSIEDRYNKKKIELSAL